MGSLRLVESPRDINVSNLVVGEANPCRLPRRFRALPIKCTCERDTKCIAYPATKTYKFARVFIPTVRGMWVSLRCSWSLRQKPQQLVETSRRPRRRWHVEMAGSNSQPHVSLYLKFRPVA